MSVKGFNRYDAQGNLISVERYDYESLDNIPSDLVKNTSKSLVNYYLKTETYTKEEVQELLSAIPKFSIQPVDALPIKDISATTVYLLKSEEDSPNLYIEYIYVNDKWECLGSQTVDLSGYALKENVPTKLSQLENDSHFLSDKEILFVTSTDGGVTASHTGTQVYQHCAKGGIAFLFVTGSVVPISDFSSNTALFMRATSDEVDGKVRIITHGYLLSPDNDVITHTTNIHEHEIITNTSQLTNDSGFITKEDDSLKGFAKTSDIPKNTSDLRNDSDFQTEAQVTSLINGAISAQTHWRFEKVNSLPQTGVENTIYLVPNSESGNNVYDEYIWIASDNKFEVIGSTAIALDNLVTKEEFNSYKNYATPQMFGAKADGSTDDTEAIQDALDSSSYVYFPDGTYMIDAVSGGIKPNSNQIIVLSNRAVLKAITNGEKAYNIVNIHNVSNVHISGGMILGDNATHDPANGGDAGYGILIKASSKITVENMEIADCWGDCIMTSYNAIKDDSGEYYGEQCEDLVITNCTLHGGRRQGISIVSGIGVSVRDCEIYNITEKAPKGGIDIEPDWVGVTENVVIEGCYIHDTSGASIIVSGEEERTKLVKISNCHLDSLNRVWGEKLTIDNCDIRSLTLRNDGYTLVTNCNLNKITTSGGSALVTNCNFENGNETAMILSTLDGFSGDQSVITERLSFINCRFKTNTTATKFLHLVTTTTYAFHQEKIIEFIGCKMDLSGSTSFGGRIPGEALILDNCEVTFDVVDKYQLFTLNQVAPTKFIIRNSKISCNGSLNYLLSHADSGISHYIELVNNEISPFKQLLYCDDNNCVGTVRLINNQMSNETIINGGGLEVFSTSGYALKSELPSVPTKTSQLQNDSGFLTSQSLTGYATENYVKDYAQPKGNYLTEHQDISGKANKSDAEEWTFTLADGSTVTKKVVLA